MTAFVQGKVGSYSSGTSFSTAYTSANAVNNLLIGCFFWQTGKGNPTISDTLGNAWVPIDILRTDTNVGADYRWYACLNSKAGANTVKATYTSTLTFGASLIHEFTDPSGPHTLGFALDQIKAANGGAATATSFTTGNTPTTTVANELVIGWCLTTSTTVTPGAGYATAVVSSGVVTEFKNVTSKAVQAANFTCSPASTWDALCSTFYTVQPVVNFPQPSPDVYFRKLPLISREANFDVFQPVSAPPAAPPPPLDVFDVIFKRPRVYLPDADLPIIAGAPPPVVVQQAWDGPTDQFRRVARASPKSSDLPRLQTRIVQAWDNLETIAARRRYQPVPDAQPIAPLSTRLAFKAWDAETPIQFMPKRQPAVDFSPISRIVTRLAYRAWDETPIQFLRRYAPQLDPAAFFPPVTVAATPLRGWDETPIQFARRPQQAFDGATIAPLSTRLALRAWDAEPLVGRASRRTLTDGASLVIRPTMVAAIPMGWAGLEPQLRALRRQDGGFAADPIAPRRLVSVGWATVEPIARLQRRRDAFFAETVTPHRIASLAAWDTAAEIGRRKFLAQDRFAIAPLIAPASLARGWDSFAETPTARTKQALIEAVLALRAPGIIPPPPFGWAPEFGLLRLRYPLLIEGASPFVPLPPFSSGIFVLLRAIAERSQTLFAIAEPSTELEAIAAPSQSLIAIAKSTTALRAIAKRRKP